MGATLISNLFHYARLDNRSSGSRPGQSLPFHSIALGSKPEPSESTLKTKVSYHELALLVFVLNLQDLGCYSFSTPLL